MMAAKSCLIFIELIALQIAHGHRLVRSPDKMEIDVPNRRPDSEEYQEDMNNEAEYWNGQGEDKGKEGHGQMDNDKDKNEETYHHEKEHHHNNQQTYNNEVNETYQADKDRFESHHEDNQDHYQEHHGNDFETQTVPDKTNTETGDRYGDKGNEFKEEGGDAMQNYESGQDNPTITYTKD